MPVYDYTYKTWEGERRGPLFRWLAIPKFTYLELLGRKLFIWIFTVAWVPFLLWLAYVYLMVNLEFLRQLKIPIKNLPRVDGRFFKLLIDVQLPLCFFFTFLIGANLISRDLKHNALVLYVSKPIGRWEYLLGKFLAVFGLLMLLVWLQPMLLFVMQWAVSPANSDWRLYFFSKYLWLVWPIAIYAGVVSATLALMILAASSLTRNGRYAGATFAIYIIGCNAVGLVVAGVFEAPAARAISPLFAAWELGFYLFGLAPWYGTMAPRWAVAAGILGQCGLCLGILYWRLRRAARYER